MFDELNKAREDRSAFHHTSLQLGMECEGLKAVIQQLQDRINYLEAQKSALTREPDGFYALFQAAYSGQGFQFE